MAVAAVGVLAVALVTVVSLCADVAVAPRHESLAIRPEVDGGTGAVAGGAGAVVPVGRLAVGILLEAGGTGVCGGGEHHGSHRIEDILEAFREAELGGAVEHGSGTATDVDGIVAITAGAGFEAFLALHHVCEQRANADGA